MYQMDRGGFSFLLTDNQVCNRAPAQVPQAKKPLTVKVDDLN